LLRKIKNMFRRRRAQPLVKGKVIHKAKIDKGWLVGGCFYLFYLILLFLEFSPWISWAERGEKFLGAALLSGIMIFLLLGYLNRYKKDIISYGSHLGLFLLVNIFVTYLSWGIWKVSGLYYFLPIPLLGFLLTPFLGVGVSFLGVILVSFVISLLGMPSWDILIYGVVGGTVSTLAVSYTHRRMEILKAGLVVGIIFLLYHSNAGISERRRVERIDESLFPGVEQRGYMVAFYLRHASSPGAYFWTGY